MRKSIFIFFIFILKLNCVFSTTTTTDPFTQEISANVFVTQNKFYVGAAAANADSSIASLELARNNGAWTASFVGKVPAKGINVNGAANKVSSMNDQIIDKLAIQTTTKNEILLVAASKVADEQDATAGSIALIDFSKKSELTNTNKINDAAGTELKNNDYAALTASADTIFVAVPPSTGAFGSANSGIVRLKQTPVNTDGLKVQKLDGTGSPDDTIKALKIDLDAVENESINNSSVNFALKTGSDPVAFTLGTATDMWWDEKLACLYEGLSNATTDVKDKQAGACALLVGQITSNKLTIRTAIPLSVLKESNTDSVIYYSNKNTDQAAYTVSTFGVRTMHTSTGKDYIIVIGDVSLKDKSTNTQINVYALPLTTQAGNTGMIAAKTSAGTINFGASVTTKNDMLTKTSDGAKLTVGSNFQYLVHASSDAALVDAKITGMQVMGDTVFVSNAGTRGTPNGDTAGESGIFYSTAIFSEDGSIRAWTPWQRSMGAVNKVSGFAFDKNTSNVWYLTPDKNGKITNWGMGDGTLHQDNKTLPIAMQSIFYDSAACINPNVGIIHLINFDDETPGFLSWNPATEYPAFSMMVATGSTGYGKVALIQMGTRDTNSIFQPTSAFISDSASDQQNVFAYDVNIGLITCAEVSRSTADSSGWLFVGGSNGLAVIRSDTDGTGWTDLSALSKNDFPAAGYSFKTLTDSSGKEFSDVRKLIADGTYLYVVSANTIYMITMNADDFYSGKIDSSRIKILSLTPVLEVFDAILINNSAAEKPIFALASQIGLRIASWNGSSFDLGYAKGTQTTNFDSGPVIKLNFISSLRGGKFNTANKADGNLYATVFDKDMINLYVYRFNVQSTSNVSGQPVVLTLFNEPYTENGFTQKYFYKITSFDKLEKSIYINQIFDSTLQVHQFVNSLAITPDPNLFLPNSSGTYNAIDLGIKTNKIPMFGTVTQDTASGAQYIPGSFGLVVNE